MPSGPRRSRRRFPSNRPPTGRKEIAEIQLEVYDLQLTREVAFCAARTAPEGNRFENPAAASRSGAYAQRVPRFYPVARDPSLRENQRCGLCGRVETLTKAHVPPQAAGNIGAEVVRSHFVATEDKEVAARDSRQLSGGMWVYGHCSDCNAVASRHDGEYGRICRAMVNGASGGRYYFPPPSPISPGAVARSVLMGMFALAPHLRDAEPRLARQLASDERLIDVPLKNHLYLARTFGNRGRVSGPVGWFMPLRPSPRPGSHWGANVAAQVWFTPLAWILAVPNSLNTYVDLLHWQDVTDWVAHPVEHRQSLSRAAVRLPVVLHPSDSADSSDHPVELLNDEITHYLRCEMTSDIESSLLR